MNEKAIKRALAIEESRRARLVSLATLDPKLISAGHVPQELVLRDQTSRQIWLCSRRAAKSVTVCAKMAHIATKYPNSIVIYFGATAKAVRLLIWSAVWQMFRKKWGVGGTDNETLMMTRFGNGSVVFFVGTDDYRHVETLLGGKLRAVFIDEAQSQPDSVLFPLVDRILPPALSDLESDGGSWLILSGTIPEVEAGVFYNIWRDQSKYPTWARHNWSRFENPHIESKQALIKYLVESGHSIEDSIVQRDWFGKFVFAAEMTAFRYDRAKAGYDGKYPAYLNMFSVGVDPGTRDRTALVVWGWSDKEDILYHVHEWVTPKDSHTAMSDIARELSAAYKRFNPMPFLFIDMGGSKMAVDTFTRDYGLPVIEAAKKSDRFMQVKRFSDLLGRGRCKIRIGSELESDLQRAQWDKDAFPRHEWSSIWHPDVADAARYAMQGYFDFHKLPVVKQDRASAEAAREEKEWRESFNPPEPQPWRSDLDNVGYGYGGK